MLKLFYLLCFLVIIAPACCEETKVYSINCDMNGQSVVYKTHTDPDVCYDADSDTWYIDTTSGFRIITSNCMSVEN